jgi:hypothetical protein
VYNYVNTSQLSGKLIKPELLKTAKLAEKRDKFIIKCYVTTPRTVPSAVRTFVGNFLSSHCIVYMLELETNTLVHNKAEAKEALRRGDKRGFRTSSKVYASIDSQVQVVSNLIELGDTDCGRPLASCCGRSGESETGKI